MRAHVKTNSPLPQEQQAIWDKCFHPSGMFVEFPIEDVETSIPARFEKIVRLHADRLAIQTKTQSLSYKEIDRESDRIAAAVLKYTKGRNRPVGILLEHGAGAVVAILGILKARGIYMPLEASLPVGRLKQLLEDSRSALLVTNSQYLRIAEKISGNIVNTL